MNKIDVLKMTDGELDRAVMILGTDYDRKRKVTSKILTKMRKMESKGKEYADIARELGFSTKTVRYNLDENYRTNYKLSLSGVHTGKDHITKKNRVAYKRELVAMGKVTAAE